MSENVNKIVSQVGPSLSDEVLQIVSQYGPLKITDILGYLRLNTDASDARVTNSIESILGIVAVGPDSYDSTIRIIGNESKQFKIRDAIRVNLIDRASSVLTLHSSLEEVGFEISVYTLVSLLKFDRNIEHTNNIVQLVEVTEELGKYAERFRYYRDTDGLSSETLRKIRAYEDGDVIRLAEFDSTLNNVSNSESSIRFSEPVASSVGQDNLDILDKGSGYPIDGTRSTRDISVGLGNEERATLLNAFIADFEFSVRTLNCLRNENIVFISDLVQKTESELLKLQNFGRKSLAEIKGFLKENGLSLGTFVSEGEWSGTAQAEPIPGTCTSLVDVAHCFDNLPFRKSVRQFDLSIRLRNALSVNEDKIDEKFPTFAAIIESKNGWEDWFRGCSNVGRKTIKELGQVISKILVTVINGKDDMDGQAANQEPAELFVYQLVFGKDWELSSYPLAHKLDLIKRRADQFDGQFSFDDSSQELDRIYELLSTEPDKSLEAYLRKTLPAREYDVVERRFGLRRRGKQTLQQIANSYEVTRERIRQLELKAIRKCKNPVHLHFFRRYMDAKGESEIESVLAVRRVILVGECNAIEKELDGHLRFSIDVGFGDISQYLNRKYDQIVISGRDVGWWDPALSEIERKEICKKLKNGGTDSTNLVSSVRKVLTDSPWPISINWLAEKLVIFSEEQLVSVIEGHFEGLVSNNEVTNIKHIPVGTKLILSLRSLGRSAHLTEISARHNAIFGDILSASAAGATLSRLGEVLIVDRGYYCLYEHLNLTEKEISTVANFCKKELRGRGAYTSAKILSRELCAVEPSLASRINPYVVLGICQDDEGFDVKRGLMLGLAKEGFDPDFTSLTDSIRELVVAEGPISITEIKAAFSHTRELLYVTIGMLLDTIDDVIRVDRGTYDYIERVFASEDEKQRLVSALTLCLIEGPCSLPVLSTRLAGLEFPYSNFLVISFLQTLESFELKDTLINLVSVPEVFEKYNQVFELNFRPELSPKENLVLFRSLDLDSDAESFVELDFRLRMPVRSWQNASSKDESSATIIDEILKDFGF
jgi:RNA polymerase primary sigma factor